jgi:hypothetical protein
VDKKEDAGCSRPCQQGVQPAVVFVLRAIPVHIGMAAALLKNDVLYILVESSAMGQTTAELEYYYR